MALRKKQSAALRIRAKVTPRNFNGNISNLMLQDANFDCSSTGFALQAMDSSHVSLIHMQV